jgi:ferrous iron transport protein A
LIKVLSQYKPGESGTVVSVEQDALRSQLIEMGFYEGKKIKLLFRAPLGDPIAVDVDGYVLSLRLNEARLVSLEYIGKEHLQ